MRLATRRWAEVPDLVAVLRRRWEAGGYLKVHASGDPWVPIVLPVKGPSSDELLHRFDEVRRWADLFERKASALGLEIEHRTVGGRSVGTNRLPARVRLATFEQLCSVLGTSASVAVLHELLAMTAERRPELVGWARQHPLDLLGEQDSWERILATVTWIGSHDTRSIYLRQIDVDGVDTKFVERHQRLLAELLPLVLQGERVSPPSEGTADFARRFGFLGKPTYVRFRMLDLELSPFPDDITELSLRVDELARRPLGAETVFIVENEVTYLAFPPASGAIVVFGSGFASATLADLPWLAGSDVVYWGDIDTHGFDILNRLRARVPNVRTMLMDHGTLLAHRNYWTTESAPTRRPLPHLTESEQSLYQDLIGDVYGIGVRLEQERLRISKLHEALARWALPSGHVVNNARNLTL
ncbi:MAG: Wadjet anti-phage system protein JetD domain-containing protein [Acidimicrobiales bacterium]